MDKLLYVAMSGAKTAMFRQAVNNNNLANINTTGFREDIESATDVQVEGQALPTRVYVDVEKKGINSAPGTIMNTGRNLDIAIQGEGMIAVQNPDGSEAYTRAGNLKISPSGLLETADQLPVMGNNGPIIISPYESLEIGMDGTISIQTLGDTSGSLVVLDRIKLVNPDADDLQKNNNGTLTLAPQLTKTTTIERDPEGATAQTETALANPQAEADNNVGIISGALETSNVNPGSALITMVELSRNFEMQIKLMKVAEDNDTAINRILT